MPNKITDEEVQLIIKEYQNGMIIRDIAKKYKHADSTILSHLRKSGIHNPIKYYWSKSEIEILEKYYSYSEWDKILELLPNRTKHIISQKASSLGIKRELYFWDKKDIDFLKTNYGKYNSIELEKLFNNKYTSSAIKSKADKLGLSHFEKWTDNEIQILKNYYSFAPLEDVMKMLPNKTYNAILGQAKKYNLTGYFNISTYYSKEQDQYIIDNWSIMTDSQMGSILCKSANSIMERRHRLGLYFISKDYSGYDDFSKFFRAHLNDWKNESIKKSNFECILTKDKNFQIHHIYGFNLILKETFEKLDITNKLKSKNIQDYSKDELDEILEIFLDIHNKYPLGVCIRQDIHSLFHKIYGAGGNTVEQWNCFYNNYKNKKYDKLIA